MKQAVFRNLRHPVPGFSTFLAMLAVLIAGACEPSRTARDPATAPPRPASAGTAAPMPTSPVPVEADDPTWGDANAPVTLVAFLDLECPYCARSEPIITELENRHGPSELRVVWKHFPLPFHPHAETAARAARAAYELGGSPAFFKFVSALFADREGLGDAAYARAARAAGVDPSVMTTRMATSDVIARVHRDMGLAGALGVTGTPQFFVNGTRIEGLVPVPLLEAFVQRELQAAAILRAKGAAAGTIYALRSSENYEPPKAEPDEPAAEPEDTHVWPVPVGDSPSQGPEDALVTIIEFSDYECPFCKRVQPALDEIRKRYGADVRIVWKHAPLPFHEHAKPAAILAAEARVEKGNAGFWKATEFLFEASPRLDDETLRSIGRKLKLDATKVERALYEGTRDAEIRADQAVASTFDVTGTPHFFINGKRLIGAQPLEAFTAVIDAELEATRALVKEHGVPRSRVYEERTKTGAHPLL